MTSGDLEVIERMAYEFCEMQAQEGVIYAEARYCPFLLMPDSFNQADFISQGSEDSNLHSQVSITTSQVVEAVNKGFHRGEKDFNLIVRTILCCIRGKPEWSEKILDLCIQFKGKGVVGIDIAGNEAGENPIEEEESGLSVKKLFKCLLHVTLEYASFSHRNAYA